MSQYKRPLAQRLGILFGSLAATGSLFWPATANAQVVVDWSTNPADPFTWNDGDTSNTYSGAATGGVTLNFTYGITGGAFEAGRPELAGAGTSVPGFTAGIAVPSLLTTYDFATPGGVATLQVTATNAVGQPVPLDQVQYTIVDIDRSCNRDWQDVVSTRGLLGATPVTPGIGSITNPGGTAGSIGTVQDITSDLSGAAYTPLPGSLTFRGVTFGLALNDPSPSPRPDPSGRGAGCTTAPDGDAANTGGLNNRGAEADNGSAEGNVELQFPAVGGSIDTLDFQFGNGVTAAANNGLGFDLPADPGPHGVGVLASFEYRPGIIGVAKAASQPVADLDPARSGNFLTTLTVNVENLGQVDLSNVQVTDNLDTTFGAGNYVVTAPPVVSSPVGTTTSLTGNASFDGSGDQNLLAAGGVLDDDDGAGTNGSATITFTVSFNPNGNTTFNNQVTATGQTPGGGTTTDLSDDGTVIDPNTDLDPTGPGEDDPTPITIVDNPQIGVTKQVSNIVNNGNGTYTVTYRSIVRNIGTESLTGVELTDEDAVSTFRVGAGNGTTSAVFDTTAGVNALATPPAGFPAAGYTPLTPDPAFDAAGSLRLATVPTLPVGGYGIVEYNVIVDPTDPLAPGVLNFGDGSTGDPTNDDPPYESQITATGTGATSATVVTDLSDDVSSFPGIPLPPAQQLPADFNGNGTATDPVAGTTPQPSPIPANDPNAATNENNRTPITLPAGPQIGVTKQVQSVTPNGDGTSTITYRHIVSNLGPEDISGVALTEQQTVDQIFREGQPNGVTSAEYVVNSLSVPATPPAGLPAAGYQVLTPTAAFDGNGNLELGTLPTLPVGGYGIIDYQVIVNPTDPLDPSIQNLGDGTAGDPTNDDPSYDAQVIATGTGVAAGIPVSDLSDDVTNLPPAQQLPQDLNGNQTATDGAGGPGTPGGPENDVTPLILTASPQIGLTKRVVSVTPAAAGGFDVVFEYVVENIGTVPLNGVTISDNYDDQFTPNNAGSSDPYEVVSINPPAGSPLVSDPGAPGSVNGSNLIPIASGVATVFNPGDTATTQVTVRVSPSDLSAIYDANAVATGNSTVDGQSATDLSDTLPQFGVAGPGDGIPGPGTVPGDPNDPANTPTLVSFPSLQLFKRITSATISGQTRAFSAVTGSVPDASFVGETDIRNVGDLQVGDTVEYTIYYFSSFNAPLNNVQICDPVPSPLNIIDGSLVASPAASGQVIAPLVPLPAACNVPNGASPRETAVFSITAPVPPATGGSVTFQATVE